jgi:Phytanoyl-CoA dioxygenase (PhyH)
VEDKPKQLGHYRRQNMNPTIETKTQSPVPKLPRARLTLKEIKTYTRQGYFVFRKPVLPQSAFAKLQRTFERILAGLPGDVRPETMDVPHFMHPELFEHAFDPSILDLISPILGDDLALFSTHFICKPKGNGKRVPWHEDSAYWAGQIIPMEVCTLWLAIDSSTRANGCMMVIPRTHIEGRAGFSDYADVDTMSSVFSTEILKEQRDDKRRVYLELQPNECSLHDARIQHGSEPNLSNVRRCGWTLRFCPTRVKFDYGRFGGGHQVYLARGKDRGGNIYADPSFAYPEVMRVRSQSGMYKGSH